MNASNIINIINQSTDSEIINLLDSFKESVIVKALKQASEAYHNDTPLLSDHKYDVVYDFLKSKFPKSKYLKTVGSKVTGEPVALPFWLGSMDKIKTEKEIKKWLSSNKNDTYIISDKLDGASALYFNNKLYTRGDGMNGKDISWLLDYLDLPTSIDFAVRGELVISKTLYPNARNIVVGVLNSKTKDTDTVAMLIRFIAYEVIFPDTKHQPSQSQQLSLLKYHKFTTPSFKLFMADEINEERLTQVNDFAK